MALAVNTLLDDLSLTPTGTAVVAPAIAAVPAPAYVPLGFAPIPPNPTIAPPPDGQFMGRGGTPFGSIPVLYAAPRDDAGSVGDTYRVPSPEVYGDSPNPVPAPGANLNPARPGEDNIVLPPLVPAPIKPDVPEALDAVKGAPAGPVRGMLAGFDLATVPLWAWLVGAALVGARFLK
jgi:hypothetical protein